MREVLAYLEEREAEFERHLSIARLLEARVDESPSEGDARVEVRHVNTLKSGLLIHLYNIVEATTTRTMKTVGQTVVAENPRLWSEGLLKEWIRAEIWNGEERIGESVLDKLTRVSGLLISGDSPNAFVIKGEPGSWDDIAIKKVSKRLGCSLVMTEEVSRAAYERVYLNDATALQYLAGRRNAIAHGEATFEEGARDLTLDELSKLSARVLPFLRAVASSYEAFLAEKRYLVAGEAA